LNILFVIFTDLLSYIASLISLNFLAGNQVLLPLNIQKIIFILLTGIFFIICIHNFKGYKSNIDFSVISEITALINASFTTILVVIITLFIFKTSIPKTITAFEQLIFIGIFILLPIIFRLLLKRFINYTKDKVNVFVVGMGEIGKSFIDTHGTTKNSKFKIMGVFDDLIEIDFKYKNHQILGKISDIPNFIKKNNVKRLLVAIRHISSEKIEEIEEIALNEKLILSFLPSIESFKNDPRKLKELAGVPLISKSNEKQTLFYMIIKRAMDIVLSIFGVIISFPLWLIIPILIFKDSKGPIFFKQERIGLNGKKFSLYKFRSMFVDSPKYAHCPVDSRDPRITKTGSWLRKTSLDELPQLLNVFKGEMSMVGPRPEMKFIVDDYNSIEKKRLLIKPGLTGLWQVSPHRNAEINHNLEYDFYYIENQSLVLDIVILILTAIFAVKGTTN
tara:strand:+ start:130 stop:1470 length:1341 start_codon:yes stop_codon:yes gene_type:complete